VIFLCVCVYCFAVFCVVCFFWVFFTLVASFPSVILYRWLGLLTCKTVSQITYTVLLETLNHTQSINEHAVENCPQTESHRRADTAGNALSPTVDSRVCRGRLSRDVTRPPFKRRQGYLPSLHFPSLSSLPPSLPSRWK